MPLVAVFILPRIQHNFLRCSHIGNITVSLILYAIDPYLSIESRQKILYKFLHMPYYQPVIRVRISLAKVMITPPARVKKPLERWDGSWD